MPKLFTKSLDFQKSPSSDFIWRGTSCLFIVCKTMFTIGESQAISHANTTANTRTPNCQYSQGKISHRKILWSVNADLKFLFNGASNKDGDSINKQRSRGNITQWMSNAKVLYEQMGAISTWPSGKAIDSVQNLFLFASFLFFFFFFFFRLVFSLGITVLLCFCI